VLGLGVDPDLAIELARQAAGEIDHLLEGRDLVAAVVDRVALTDIRDPLLGPQRPELAEHEVLGEPAGERLAVDHLRPPAAGELRAVGDVGGARDLVLVAGDEDAVLGRHEVRLNEVGAQAGSQLVGGEGVLGPVAGGAAVGDDERFASKWLCVAATAAISILVRRGRSGRYEQ
jgi:hypothetical protein